MVRQPDLDAATPVALRILARDRSREPQAKRQFHRMIVLGDTSTKRFIIAPDGENKIRGRASGPPPIEEDALPGVGSREGAGIRTSKFAPQRNQAARVVAVIV